MGDGDTLAYRRAAQLLSCQQCAIDGFAAGPSAAPIASAAAFEHALFAEQVLPAQQLKVA